MITLTINGTATVLDQLSRIQDIGTALKAPMVQSANEVRTYVAKYPPTSEANIPPATPPGRYYQRGKGMMYVYARAEIRTNKKGARRVKRGGERVTKSSEMLNRRWSTVYTFTANEAKAVIGNDASYAPYVHDRNKQARFHAQRGWRTAQEGIERFKDRMIRRFAAAIEAAVK